VRESPVFCWAAFSHGWRCCRAQASQLHAQGSCPGASNNGAGVGIGFHTVIAFSTACADIYHFRFHADYGRGGYIGVNDGAVGAFDFSGNNAGALTNSGGTAAVSIRCFLDLSPCPSR